MEHTKAFGWVQAALRSWANKTGDVQVVGVRSQALKVYVDGTLAFTVRVDEEVA